MGQRVSLCSKLKPIGVGGAKASLNRAQDLDLSKSGVTRIRPETG